jgi:hypothetical protein
MPRRDDEYEDDDRPRRRPRDDNGDDDRPRRRFEEDDDRSPRRKKKSSTGLVIGILAVVFLLCCGGGGFVAWRAFKGAKEGIDKVVAAVGEVQETEESRQNLTRIGMAIHNYHDAMNALPNNSYGPQGKQSRPLLSWRVHILPHLGENALYQQFKLDEPWDSASNRRLLSQMPAVYGGPDTRKKAGEGKTFYRGFSHRGAIFEKPQAPGAPPPRIALAQIPDGTTNTIMVIDAGESVEWTRPDDIDWSPGRRRPALGGAYPSLQFCMVLMANGAVRTMRKDIQEQTFRNLIGRDDGIVIPDAWDQP